MEVLMEMCPTVEHAQSCAVHHHAALFTPEQIDEIREFALQMKKTSSAQTSLLARLKNAGLFKKKCKTFIHEATQESSNNFQRELIAKLTNHALATDSETWGFVKQFPSFNPMTGEMGDPSVRSLEFIEYSEGGGLLESMHYDHGSLLTMVVMLSKSDD